MKEFKLHGTEKGKITVMNIDHPYGKNSESVASIGISLSGDSEPDWKIHLPYENLDEVIEALQSLKK